MNVLYIFIFALACVLILLSAWCLIKRKADCKKMENATEEAEKKTYRNKVRKDNKFIKFICYAFFSSCIMILIFTIGKGMVKKGVQGFVIAQIKAGNREENFDPRLICEQELTLSEEEDGAEQNYRNLLNYSWYEEVGNSKEEYIKKVSEWLNGKEMVMDSPVDMLEGEQKNKYDQNKLRLDEIECLKVLVESAEYGTYDDRGIFKRLTAELYEEEYLLRMDCFNICSTAAMLQQTAKSALDVETVEITGSAEWDRVTEYAGYGIQRYADLTSYVSASESKADCCYWIAKTYKELAENSPEEYKQYEQHCYLMAYAFAAEGERYANMEAKKSHHLADLSALKSKVETYT